MVQKERSLLLILSLESYMVGENITQRLVRQLSKGGLEKWC